MKRATLVLVVLLLAAPGAESAGRIPEGVLALRYVFVGARTNDLNSPFFATSVHCSNMDSTTVDIEARFIDWDSVPVGASTLILQAGTTGTWSAVNTLLYEEDTIVVLSNELNQGMVQIWSDSSEIFCTAQVLEADQPLPDFLVELPAFRPDGVIFADGFETGDTSAWSVGVP